MVSTEMQNVIKLLRDSTNKMEITSKTASNSLGLKDFKLTKITKKKKKNLFK